MLIDFVWEISTDNGDINYDQKAIRSAIVDHFKTLFSQMQGFNMENQLKLLKISLVILRMRIVFLLVSRYL